MGTRAAFWIGDPRQIKKRELLGCKAFDGYPEGIDGIQKVKTVQGFRKLVSKLRESGDVCDPSKGWPYPWDDDIFLTDYTYAFFGGKLWVSIFHTGFASLRAVQGEAYSRRKNDPTCQNVPAPSRYDSRQPDSVIIVEAR